MGWWRGEKHTTHDNSTRHTLREVDGEAVVMVVVVVVVVIGKEVGGRGGGGLVPTSSDYIGFCDWCVCVIEADKQQRRHPPPLPIRSKGRKIQHH